MTRLADGIEVEGHRSLPEPKPRADPAYSGCKTMTTEQHLTRDELLDRGRAAHDSRQWAAAFDALMAADREAPLGLDDLERLGLASHLVGRSDISVSIGIRGFTAAAEAGEVERAAMAGFWTGMTFAWRGDFAQAGAWFGRSAELVEKSGRDLVESGYLLIPVGLVHLEAHDGEAAIPIFEQIAEIAERFADPDLATFGRLGRGQALIAMGERERGLRILDEAMARVTAGEVSPSVAGIVYCTTIEECHANFDLRRAREWTEALTEWCDAQPDIVFRGRCQVYRAELMRFHGDWTTAAEEAERAMQVLLGPPVSPAVAEAHYEEAELHRLQGRFEEAEQAYVAASQFGFPPEPGIALLRLAQGQAKAARGVIARALEEQPGNPRLLDAAIAIALGRGDAADARAHLERLRDTAGPEAPPLLRAITARAEGEVLLAEGRESDALRTLRAAFGLWQELDAPHDAARVRVGIARACRALGDSDTAGLEIAAARRVFEDLGATPALADLDRAAAEPAGNPGGLSSRELEVLRHLAGGRTNREIADGLGISERTVDRHVSNLYTKLDVTSRAAATAWAYEHDLA